MLHGRSAWPALLIPVVSLLVNCTPPTIVTTTDVADVALPEASPDALHEASADAPFDAASDIVLDAHDVLADVHDPSSDSGSPVPECTMSAVTDLNTVGTLTDIVTRYVASNASAPSTGGLTAPSCQSNVGHALVFKYTAHSTATLRVSTNNAGTAFDTVVWGLDRCASAGATELGCTDDDNVGLNASASTFLTASRVNAGQTVYFVVAGAGDATGAVEITVAELRDVAVGGTCDPSGATTICSPAPADCITSGGMSRCEMPMYIESGIATPMFLDACATGTRATLVARAGGDPRDDGHITAGVTIPFAFHFFGAAVTTLWPSTNGYAVFDATPTDSNGGDLAIPMSDEGAVIAPFWQNLVLRAAPASDICTAVFGTTPSRQFAIEWLDVMPSGNTTSHVTFEVLLSEGTANVDIVYQQLDPGTSPPEESDGTWSAIGVQSNHGDRSLLHNGSVDTMNGVRFAPL